MSPLPGARRADRRPHTGRARLGYDRARVLLDEYAGLDLDQLHHSAATRLGEAEIPLQLIMGKTRHKNPRAAMRYVKPVILRHCLAESIGVVGSWPCCS
ncbi:hypothetical protein [Nonomuraea helvata]|uniref:Tyr recombinase domain-containing protein n=1 Tax=Nonomuraea helvata TaxID=37484 RepID=A0ABV5S3A3_9ACTN